MDRPPYTKGLHRIGTGTHAYLQPDGSFGWSNAGLITDGASALLVDTLHDLPLTQAMLDTMAQEVEAARCIGTLVLTHANPDHVNGNQLVKGAEIISSRACAEEMAKASPQRITALLEDASAMGALGAYLSRLFSPFHFEGITLTLPTKTFKGRLDLTVGGKAVHLIEVGPCHSTGDVIVFVPDDRVVYAGDTLFIGGMPVMWEGPLSKWMAAYDLMLDLEADTFVPGHGPVTDKNGIESNKAYWTYVQAEARKRFEDGMPLEQAVSDIDPGPYRHWGDTERIALNVASLYREFRHDERPLDPLEVFGLMAKMAEGSGAS